MLLEFQKALAEEVREITADMWFCDRSGKETPLHVFEQILPLEKAEVGTLPDEESDFALPEESIMASEETEPFPYCVVRIEDGEQQDAYSSQYVSTQLIIGIYDSDRAKAYQGVLNVIQRFRERFYKNSILAGRYRMQDAEGKQNIQWTIEEGTTLSYFFGGIAAVWQIPSFGREEQP